jgi:DNA damage-binding protein 1
MPRVSELNILSLAFLSVGAGNYAIAILHLDHNQNLQLLARDLILSERELSPEPSLLLPPTIISSAALAPIEVSPCLVTVQPQQSNGTKEPIPGGILVLGGRKIRFLEQSSAEWQDKHRERRQKLRSPKKNAAWPQGGNVNEQKAREIKKRKAKATVDWPWREVNAYVSHNCSHKFLIGSRWCPANDEGTRFFVGDSYGRLALLSFDSTVERTLRVIPLGEVRSGSTCSKIIPDLSLLGFSAYRSILS